MSEHMQRAGIGTLFMLVGLLAACGDKESPPAQTAADETAPVAAQKAAANRGTSPGKPSPPISIDYKVVGVPIVGQPVTVELEVSSSITVREMRVSYQVMDPVVLFLPETQARESLFTEVAEGQIRSPRVSVIPQAEGRSYLGVLVEIDTDEGLWTRAASIPIQVGNVRAEPRLNGELQTDEQGEAVISMPARED